eukprot:864267-Amphidinium_carterae.3
MNIEQPQQLHMDQVGSDIVNDIILKDDRNEFSAQRGNMHAWSWGKGRSKLPRKSTPAISDKPRFLHKEDASKMSHALSAWSEGVHASMPGLGVVGVRSHHWSETTLPSVKCCSLICNRSHNYPATKYPSTVIE